MAKPGAVEEPVKNVQFPLIGALAAATLCAGCATASAPATADAAIAPADAASDVQATPLPKWSTHKIYVFDTIGFTRLDKEGHTPGWDLDGVVSGTDDVSSCGHADFTAPDGTPGIDNQFATLVPLIEATGISAVEKLLQASIESGGILMLMELDGLDDLVTDPEVHVRVRAAFGLPLLGTDGRLLTDQTFHVSPRDPSVDAGIAKLAGGVLETKPFDIDLPVQVFGKDYTLEARGAHVRFRIVDAERIVDGVLGAGITIASVKAIAKKGAEDQSDILPIVNSLVDGNGDLARDADGVCQQLSAGLQFTGVSAFFFPADVTASGK